MNKNDDIVIDSSSGISVEEQREILSQINSITEKNKRQLSENAPVKKEKIIAKKKGFIFPLAVNIAAAALLGIGAFLLISFNSKVDEQVKTGNVVFNLTERALIDEIRKDTAEQIAAKEAEISAITSRVEEIDKELLQLYSSNINLTSEQIAARERLLAMQGTFREELSVLNTERSQILESSRTREARLRAQLEERTREFDAAHQRVSGELETAVNELEKLSSEQEKIAAIDAHFAGSAASINALIQKTQYAQAAQTVANLRDFLNNNLVSQSASFRVKREYYNQSLNLLELLIADAHRNSAAGSSAEQIELAAKNTQLQETIDSMQKTIDASNTGSSSQTQRIREMEEASASLRNQVTSLRTEKTTLEQHAADKDRTITTLQTENTNLTSNNTELRTTITGQEQRIADLNNQLTAIRQLLLENQ